MTARAGSDPDPHVRMAAVRAVTRTAPRPGAMLAPVADDDERLVRLEVARHLAAPPEYAARALLADRDLTVREAAAQAAGAGQAGQLAGMLIEDPSSDVRKAAARALGSLRDERIADLLVPALRTRTQSSVPPSYARSSICWRGAGR